MTEDLFSGDPDEPSEIRLGEGAVLLKGLALRQAAALLDDIAVIAQQSPWRHMVTPGGKSMSVANTNGGELGWVSDARGYRYVHEDPLSGKPWPAIPAPWLELANAATRAAGFAGAATPDACLLNRYASGARLSLHQDRDELDFSVPIVSVSLGLPAVFLWGGNTRSEPYRTLPLTHGDVLVWGGADRLRFHGVRPLAAGMHAQAGGYRFNITLRRAGAIDNLAVT